jgi:hypothetical protein
MPILADCIYATGFDEIGLVVDPHDLVQVANAK